MNSLDFLIVFGITGIMAAFVRFAYEWGYREGHGEGYLRGRAIAKALQDKGVNR